MPLTDRAIINLKPASKQTKHFDRGGLHLVVYPTGGKAWRLSYRFPNKEKLLSLGMYPAVTLKRAREKCEEAKALLAEGIDPGEHKKEVAKVEAELTENTFENIAREWHAKFSERWEPKNARKILIRMEKDIFPFIGNRSITSIKPQELLTVVRRIELRGAVECAHRIIQYCGKVFRYAIATGRAEHDSADLRGAIPPPKTKHQATIIDPVKVGQLLRAIDAYDGHFIVASALKLAPLTFVRPGEQRGAEWDEFDFDREEWRIPAARMKMNEQHIVRDAGGRLGAGEGQGMEPEQLPGRIDGIGEPMPSKARRVVESSRGGGSIEQNIGIATGTIVGVAVLEMDGSRYVTAPIGSEPGHTLRGRPAIKLKEQ